MKLVKQQTMLQLAEIANATQSESIGNVNEFVQGTKIAIYP